MKKVKFKSNTDKEKWEKVLTSEMMSSEVSTSEKGEEILKVNKPSWRKTVVENMFEKLDRASYNNKSPQAKRQMKRRVLGEVSNRSRIEGAPKWVVNN